MGVTITHGILGMLNDRKLDEGINDTIITLIPKKANACKLDDLGQYHYVIW